MSIKLRILKVTIQPVFVADDGEVLEEKPVEPITLGPTQLSDLGQWLEDQRLALEKQLNEID